MPIILTSNGLTSEAIISKFNSLLKDGLKKSCSSSDIRPCI